MGFLNNSGFARLWSHIMLRLGDKVDKVDGKGLSTKDFTTEEKEKLAGLSTDGFVSYNEQELTEDQQTQARKNQGLYYSEVSETTLVDNATVTIETAGTPAN